MAKVMIIAVHPDDETLGCGGTIFRHLSNGDQVYWMIVTEMCVQQGFSQLKIQEREAEIANVQEAYGFSGIYRLKFPALMLDTIGMSDLVGRMSEVINEVQPEIVYAPNHSDVHTDHRIAFEAVISCTKAFRFPFVKKVLMYETLSETEFSPSLPSYGFHPNVFVDTTEYHAKKLETMQLYTGELMDSPWPRSLDAISGLAAFRGGRIGRKYAESFVLLQEVI